MDTIVLVIIATILLNLGVTFVKNCDNYDILYIYMYLAILSIIVIIATKKKPLIKINQNIVLATIFIFLGYTLFMYLIKNNDISRMMIYKNVLGILFIALVGYYYFKEQLTLTNIIGIALICLGIYMLSIKKSI